MSTDIDKLLDHLNELEEVFGKQVTVSDMRGAVDTLKEASVTGNRLHFILGSQGNISHRTNDLRRFRDRKYIVLAVAEELGIEYWNSADPIEIPASFSDQHLAKIIDFENPDWADTIDQRLIEIAFLVTNSSLPEWVLRHFKTARRCYALGMFDVTFIFLRGMIEAVSFEWLTRRGYVQSGSRVRSLAEWRLQDCLRLVRERSNIPKPLMKGIADIVRHANQVIHSKRSVKEIDQSTTFRAFKVVTHYSERLFL